MGTGSKTMSELVNCGEDGVNFFVGRIHTDKLFWTHWYLDMDLRIQYQLNSCGKFFWEYPAWISTTKLSRFLNVVTLCTFFLGQVPTYYQYERWGPIGKDVLVKANGIKIEGTPNIQSFEIHMGF